MSGAKKMMRLSEAVGVIQRDGSLDIRSLTLTMWKCRGDPAMVQGLGELLMDKHASKEVFEGVEFFLPQLVHMILHLEIDWPRDLLQEFCYMLAQVSLHFVLQMHWILIGVLEDCQPELSDGKKNPNGNAEMFIRCSTLLFSLEKAVVYGGDLPQIRDLEREYSRGYISKTQMDLKMREIRQKQAKDLVLTGAEEAATLEGTLLFKRSLRTSTFQKKPWKERKFVLRNRVLLCYRSSDNVLKRALPLYNCEIREKEHRNHKYYFEVAEKNSDRIFHLAAPNESTRAKWIREIRKAIESPPVDKASIIDASEMSEDQKVRHQWMRSELQLVRSLTDIAEELRHIAVPDRQATLKRRMLKVNKDLHAMNSYLDMYNPLCRSTDLFEKIVSADSNGARAFSTRERCPILVVFETVRQHVDGVMDVANYLHDKYGGSFEEGLRDMVKATLAPVLSVSVTKASLWDEEDDIVSLSKTPSKINVHGHAKLIAKSHDDLRQEMFIMQLLRFLQDIWTAADLQLWLKPYRIISTSSNTGLIQFLEGTNSLDSIKGEDGKGVTLLQHFQEQYPDINDLEEAQIRFTESLAGYSLACYILGIKDRHNGNILLSEDGRVIHIDFGFVLGMAPGKDKVLGTNFSLERAPFKLTNEMVEVIGGVGSAYWKHFVDLFTRGLLVVRENVETLIGLVEISGYKSKFPCFQQSGGVPRITREMTNRLFLSLPPEQLERKVEHMILHAKQHTGTILYEKFQERSNGITPIY